ncbi:MAG TPA: lysylphosphatidylglycerol synthase transmembrane domain-containing protein [Gemmatimonadaceae bacterium]|nr:lysylphosphatidylglycerol synthase transmembrane domain-containing protein [Gemmatimonadaceae bacterium]
MRIRPAVLRTLAVVVVVFAAVALWRQWESASRQQLRFSIDLRWLTAASLLFLATYVILIEMWRRVLAVYGRRISFVDAAHVWFVSNLGKYVPGKIWQVTASTAMMTQLGTPAIDAGSAAAVIAIVNVLAGFAIVLAAGFGLLRALGAGYVRATIFATVFLVVASAAAPWMVPIINRIASRATRRPVTLVVPGKATWISLVGCAVSWCVYGLAFQLLVRALVGHAEGRWTAYLAAYTLSYLVGYLTLFAPGGIGARELALSSTLRALNLATPAEAALITVASRLWLTVLEVVPGVLFLPRRLKRVEAESRNVQETPPTPR